MSEEIFMLAFKELLRNARTLVAELEARPDLSEPEFKLMTGLQAYLAEYDVAESRVAKAEGDGK